MVLAAVTAHAGFSVDLQEGSYSDVRLETVITTTTRIHPAEKLVNHPSELAALARQLLALRAELATLQTEREKLLIASVEARKNLEWVQHWIDHFHAIKDHKVFPGKDFPEAFKYVDVMEGSLINWRNDKSLPDNVAAKLALERFEVVKLKPVADQVEALEKRLKATIDK
jgi:hypothetical protein